MSHVYYRFCCIFVRINAALMNKRLLSKTLKENNTDPNLIYDILYKTKHYIYNKTYKSKSCQQHIQITEWRSADKKPQALSKTWHATFHSSQIHFRAHSDLQTSYAIAHHIIALTAIKQARKKKLSKINKCPIIPKKPKPHFLSFHIESVPVTLTSIKSSYPHIITVHIQTGPQSPHSTTCLENEAPKQEAPDRTSHAVEWAFGKQNVANNSGVLCVQIEMHWSIHAWCLSNSASWSSACLGTWNVIHQWLLVNSLQYNQNRPDRANAWSKRSNSSSQIHFIHPSYSSIYINIYKAQRSRETFIVLHVWITCNSMQPKSTGGTRLTGLRKWWLDLTGETSMQL